MLLKHLNKIITLLQIVMIIIVGVSFLNTIKDGSGLLL